MGEGKKLAIGVWLGYWGGASIQMNVEENAFRNNRGRWIKFKVK